MPAHIIKAAQLTLGPAHNQQRFARQFRREVVARIRNLIAMANHLPASREDLFLLNREGSRLGVKI
jgi:hypothetical protein